MPARGRLGEGHCWLYQGREGRPLRGSTWQGMGVEPDLREGLGGRRVAGRGVVGLGRLAQGGLAGVAHGGLAHEWLGHMGLSHGGLAHGLLPGLGLGRVGEELPPRLPRHHRHDGWVLGGSQLFRV